jgi:hypothetical protein
MNESLELMRTFVVAGWLYLCVLLVVALGLLAFDRRRTQPDPFAPAGLRPREARPAGESHVHSHPIAGDRAERDRW